MHFFQPTPYHASVVQAGHHCAQKSDLQRENDRISITLTFNPHNHAVKSIILINFELLQNDPNTGRIFSQPLLISLKRYQTSKGQRAEKTDQCLERVKYLI